MVGDQNYTIIIFLLFIVEIFLISIILWFSLLSQAVLKRDIKVRMILSERVYTQNNRKKFLFSLMDLNKEKKDTFVEVKVFHVS